MGNNACPICGKKTEGKAVRDFNFCAEHRELAIECRDFPEFKMHEEVYGIFRGMEFVGFVHGTQKMIDDAL